MKRRSSVVLGLALVIACNPAPSGEETTQGTGGSGRGGAPAPGTGGGASSGSGGSPSPGTGGAPSAGTGGMVSPGTGGTPGTGGGAPNTGGSSGDTAGPAEEVGGPPSAGGPAGALNDQVFRVDCPAGTGATAKNCQIPDAMRMFKKSFTIGGSPATTYKVKLKICGVMESRQYTMCTASPDSGRICIDGKPATSPPAPSYIPTYPTLALVVTDPMRTYYLNSMWESDKISFLNYSATFEMKGGTTVSVESDGGRQTNVYTGYQNGNYNCPAPPGITKQPHLGHFVHFKVESVDPMN